MTFAGKLALWMFMFNIAALMMMNLAGDVWGSSGAIGKDQTVEVNDLRKNVTGFPADTTGSSVLIRIFDYITLGFLSKILNFFDSLLFSFVLMLERIEAIPAGMWIGNGLRVVIGMIYAIYGIELYTGRNFTGD